MSERTSIETRGCPTCGRIDSPLKPAFRAVTPAEGLSDTDLQNYFIGFRSDQCFFTYVRCSGCGQLYCQQYFSREFMSVLYSAMPENISVSGERDSERTQKGYSKLFRRIPTEDAYLELGADIGLLAKEISRLNPRRPIHVVEPNTQVHGILKANLGGKALILHSLDEVGLNQKYSDATAVHVFDHLIDPSAEVQKLVKTFTENSILTIVVHNEKSIIRYLLQKRWPPFCLQHPQIYNRKTIRTLLEQNGLEVLRIRRTLNYISLAKIFELLGSIGVAPKVKLSWLPKLSIPVPLGNISVQAAVKLRD